MVSSSFLLILFLLSLPIFMFLFFFQKQRTFKNTKGFPPGPRGLPIIGNLHQLDNASLYLQLWKLSKKYGPIFSLQLGLRPTIVVSSSELVKEMLKNHDTVFSGRPNLLGQQKLSYNGLEMIFSPYNAYWREIRKLCVTHVLSPRRVSSFSSIREFEVKQMIKKISKHAISSKAINLNDALISLTSTIICRIAFGKRYEDEGVERSRFHGLLNDCQAMMATFFVSDFIPFLGWIDRLNGTKSKLDQTFEELDKFYQEVIEEHLDQNRRKTLEGEEDIIDVLLQVKKEGSFFVDLTYDHIKGVFMDMLVAATDTTAATTVWTMTQLMKNPRVMKKVQQELRSSKNNNKDFLNEEDVQKLPYFKALIKEILRLHLPAPLLVQRETNEKSIIDGYEIPAKTIVYINAWAIHRDPKVWENPEEFYPERFLDSAIDFHGQDFEFIPFGAGRRICPGLHMADVTLDVVIANLLFSFDWEMPKGMKSEEIDTEVLVGITQHKKNPLWLVPKIR